VGGNFNNIGDENKTMASPKIDPKFRPRVADILKSLGHPSRLHIIELLAEREMTVTEIQDEIKLSQSAVSQQIAVLRNFNLVLVRRDGNRRFYSLANPRLVDLLSCLSNCQQKCQEEDI
jgi:DNA-binding transcriptional ArsR family regulator